jgi:translation initiation factor 2 gamma subunit (eIF-2gamma)
LIRVTASMSIGGVFAISATATLVSKELTSAVAFSAGAAEVAAATFGWTFLFSAKLVPALCRADIFTGSIMVPS